MSIPHAIRKTRSIVLLAALLVVATALLRAAAGDVDPTFVPDVGGPVWDSVVQPDGKIVIGGRFNSVGGSSQFALARLNDDGTNDPTFTSPIVSDYEDWVQSLALQTDGRILVAGTFKLASDSVYHTLVRVNADGSLDSTFSTPTTFGTVKKVSFLNGLILTYDTNNGLSLLNADGSVNQALPGGGRGIFVVQPDGSIVSAAQFYIYRFIRNSAGDYDFDSEFNGGNAYVYTDNLIDGLELLADGRILVCGAFSNIGGVARRSIARLLSTGVVDTSFDAGETYGEVVALAEQADGKIVAGGWFHTAAGGDNHHSFARFEADGAEDTTFAADFFGGDGVSAAYVLSVHVQPDGKIRMSGDFTSVHSIPRTFMARLLGDGPANASPVLSNVAATSSIDENGTATLAGNIADADAGDTFSLTVNWGEGLAQVFNYPAGTTSFSVQHQYLDDNPTATQVDSYSITLTLTDSGGGSDTDAASVTVSNLAPSLSAILVSPSTITAGGSTNASGTVADAGTLDSHAVVITWGDGSANTTINLAAGVTAFNASHTYSASGAFAISVSASDDDGGVTSGNGSVTVNPLGVAPAAPTGLTAAAVSTTQVNLAWIDHAGNESGFSIERCAVKGKKCVFAEIAEAGANATAFADLGLAKGTEYRYRVLAFNVAGSSAYTDVAVATTPHK